MLSVQVYSGNLRSLAVTLKVSPDPLDPSALHFESPSPFLGNNERPLLSTCTCMYAARPVWPCLSKIFSINSK